MATPLIINADDFGRANSINEAVLKAYLDGRLTSASLMVTGEAVTEAVSIAHSQPDLAVGLHLALSDARGFLPREQIAQLVDESSRFARNPARAALKYHFNRKAREQLRSEIEAQFGTFVETGLPLSHVDGHQHLHAHPAVLPIVVELAEKYGAHGIRVPTDPLLANLRADRSRLGWKLGVALGHGYLRRVCRKCLRGSSLARCDFSIGSLMSGRMRGDYVTKMLSILDCESVELYFHPTNGAESLDPYGPNAGDFDALMSAELGRLLSDGRYELTNYAGLKRSQTEAFGGCD